MKKRWFGPLAILCSAGWLYGCAATRAVQQAQVSFDKAKQAGAEKSAPYDYYAAEYYLGLAQYERGETDLKGAQGFAEKSLSYSDKALQKAEGGAK